MPQILPHLHLGDHSLATSLPALQTLQITHILNLTYEYPNAFPSSFTYLRIEADDRRAQRLRPYFHLIASFVSSAQVAGGKVLVHCLEGVSRSPTAVLACLMLNEGMRLREAFELVKSVKDDIEPNETFLVELRLLEEEMFGAWCREKLTGYDEVGKEGFQLPRGDDWEECLALVLSRAATEGVGFDAKGEWERCVLLEFAAAKGEGNDELKAILEMAVTRSLHYYGGSKERDLRARKALNDIFIHGVVGSQMCSSAEMKEALQSLSAGEAFKDLYIDVPLGKGWIDEVLQEVQEQKTN